MPTEHLLKKISQHLVQNADGVGALWSMTAWMPDRVHGNAQVLLRWGLQQGCAVIPKTVHDSYVEQYSEEALLSWQLSDDDMEELNVLEDGHKYCWNPAPIR